MNSSHVTAVLPRWVSPFGYLRIIAYLPLPEAFRSLSRPSSAPDAKAFPLRSFKLDLHCPPGRNRSRPGEVISLVLLAVLELCRLHRRFFRKIVVLPLFFPRNILLLAAFRPLALCCLAFPSSLFSFQGAAGIYFRIPSKLNNVRERRSDLRNPVGWLPPGLLRKEVIQPLVLQRLPCYDFTPITKPTFGHALLAVRPWTSGVSGSHGVTGGVYKARERIHRGMLIRDY